MKSQLAIPQYFPYLKDKTQTPNDPSNLLTTIRPDPCITKKTQNTIKFPSTISHRTKTSVLINNIIIATKERLQTIKRKAPKRKTKQKHTIQYPQHSPSHSNYFRTQSSKLHPQTSLPYVIEHSNLSCSSHSNESNSLSLFTSNDCSHQSSLHQDHKTKKYLQPEILFDPIYTHRPLITIPPPTHAPLLQYPVSYPYLNVNNIISDTTGTPKNLSTLHDDPNDSKFQLDHNNPYPTLISSLSSSSSRLHTSPSMPITHEPTKTKKQSHENKVSKVRLYHPLRHQQGVWFYPRFHQYCTQYPGVTSNNSNSSISSDNTSSEDVTSPCNTSSAGSKTLVMICLPINTTNKTIVSPQSNSFLSSSHLKLLFSKSNSKSTTQSSFISSIIDSPTTSCTILKNETKMSTNKPSITQSNNLPSSPVDITFGDELIPK